MTLRTVLIIALGFHTMLNMTRPLITLYAVQLGASTLEVGILTAVYAVFPLALAIHAGRFADRVGDRLPILIGCIGASAGLSLPFLVPSMTALYSSQISVGIAHIVINLSLQNVLGNAATKENRDHYYSMLSMTVAGGGFIGPLLGGYLADHLSYTFVFQVAAAVGIVPVICAFFIPVIKKLPEQTDNRSQETTGSLQLLKMPVLRKALISSALVLYSRDIFVAYFPLFASREGITPGTIGTVIAAQGLAMMTVRLFLGKLTAAIGRSRVLVVSILTAGLAFLLIPATGNPVLLGILSVLMGFGLGCGQPLSMTTAYNASPQSRTGEVLGLRLACNRVSQIIAPLFFGLLGSSIGLLSVFWVSGAFLIGGAFLTRTPTRSPEAGNKQTGVSS